MTQIFSLLTGLAPYTNATINTMMKAVAIISITLLLNIFILAIDGQSIVVKGNDCEFINLGEITSNSGCDSGTKYVLKVVFSIFVYEFVSVFVFVIVSAIVFSPPTVDVTAAQNMSLRLKCPLNVP